MKHGVTKAAIRYKTSRQNIYRWKKKYDGDIHSLADRSQRPHSHPKQHTEAEITLVKNMRRRNPHDGLVVFWVKLRRRGYTRSISGLYKLLRRIGGAPIKLPNPKYIPKPYEQMRYPSQKVQIDVKYVPSACLVGEAVADAKECGGYYYQYTFIDEYSRFRYLEAFKEKKHIHLDPFPKTRSGEVPIRHRMRSNGYFSIEVISVFSFRVKHEFYFYQDTRQGFNA